MFGLIRYKSDNFSENSYSNSKLCVVILSVGVADPDVDQR